MDDLQTEKEALGTQLSEGQQELHRASSQQADRGQELRMLVQARLRASGLEGALAASRGELLLARAQVARLRALLEPPSSSSSSGARLSLLNMGPQQQEQQGSGVRLLRREAAIFSAEAASATALSGSIELYRTLRRQQQQQLAGSEQRGKALALCKAALAALRAVSLGWWVVGVLGGGSPPAGEEEGEEGASEWVSAVGTLCRGLGDCVAEQLQRSRALEEEGAEAALCSGASALEQRVMALEQLQAGRQEAEEGGGLRGAVAATTQVLEFALVVKRRVLEAAGGGARAQEVQEQEKEQEAQEELRLLQALDASLARCVARRGGVAWPNAVVLRYKC